MKEYVEGRNRDLELKIAAFTKDLKDNLPGTLKMIESSVAQRVDALEAAIKAPTTVADCVGVIEANLGQSTVADCVGVLEGNIKAQEKRTKQP